MTEKTDANLADQIERWLADDPDHMGLHSLSEAQWRGIAAALRRQPHETLKAAYFEGYEDALRDRQPSSDQVLVPREPTDEIVWAICDHSDAPIDREHCLRCPAKETTYYGEGTRGCRALAEDQYRAMLAAAEAEGRKS